MNLFLQIFWAVVAIVAFVASFFTDGAESDRLLALGVGALAFSLLYRILIAVEPKR